MMFSRRPTYSERASSSTSDVIDSDGHVLEPPDFWIKYLDPEYRDRAPELFFVDTDGQRAVSDRGPRIRLRRAGLRRAGEEVDYPRYLLRLAELEMIERERRTVERRIKEARFPAVKSLDSFEFAAIPSLNYVRFMDYSRMPGSRLR